MSKNILIVEDETIVALDLRLQLEDDGYACIGPANSVSTALSLIKENEIDFAVLDVNLGGASSTSVATSLAEAGTPFIYLTGYGDRSVLEGMPMADMLHKPVAVPILLKRIRDALTD